MLGALPEGCEITGGHGAATAMAWQTRRWVQVLPEGRSELGDSKGLNGESPELCCRLVFRLIFTVNFGSISKAIVKMRLPHLFSGGYRYGTVCKG